jgi:hypothetical protein
MPGYDTYLSRCHSPCKSINRSPMFGCNGSCYVFVLVYMSYSVLFLVYRINKSCSRHIIHRVPSIVLMQWLALLASMQSGHIA